jgi:XTP/dITP diphosphohydrolase
VSAPRLIVVGSTNEGKRREIEALLGDLPVEVRGLARYPEAAPPEETGETFAENARLKAAALARQLDAWVLADDSGLCVDALGGAPGPRSARYAGDDATDEANVARLLEELRDVEGPKRGAAFVCVAVLAAPDGVVLETRGRCEGRIVRHPRGHNGFGYDPVFFYPDFGATFAEVSADAKNRVSHRGQAFRALAEQLAERLRKPQQSP